MNVRMLMLSGALAFLSSACCQDYGQHACFAPDSKLAKSAIESTIDAMARSNEALACLDAPASR